MSDLQWIRETQVIVGKKGNGLLIEGLRITFEVEKTLVSSPNKAIIKIYNLSPDNETKIKKEYDDIVLNAGFKDETRLIFRGNLKYVYQYRDGNDHITEIHGGDGDADFKNSVMNETLAAGTTRKQLVDRAVKSFSGGTIAGTTQVGSDQGLPRGQVVSGNTRHILNKVAKDVGANWSIQDGALQIVSTRDVLPGQAFEINSDTGLLGAPEISDKGISLKMLLNAKLRVNGSVKLNNNDIKAKKQKQNKPKSGQTNKAPVRLDPDGIYKVIKLKHVGDNRGEAFTEILCIGLNQPIPQDREYDPDSEDA